MLLCFIEESFLNQLPDSALGAGLGVGRGFLAGLEMPMLNSRKPKPLRNESNTLILRILSMSCQRYFISGPAIIIAADGSTRKISTAAGGSGLSALASSRLTCQISVSVSTPL